MSQQDDFLGGLHYDRLREARTEPSTTIERYHPAGGAVEPARGRVSPWWHVAGVLLGAVGAAAAVFVLAFALDLLADGARTEGLVALGVAGFLVALVCAGKLSPAAPLVMGMAALAGSVLYELETFPFLPVLRTVFESGIPVVVGVLLVMLSGRRG
ncbi:hypothetical protein [Saccharothrix hoggarensis]|uniref:Uncharacterized protein n=1 Tax=Saccharothrix hoggarensis TaxID=913853 RepID=A0ABW3QYP8_9PSEU